jgi:tRNA-dihydrouridine synthase
MEKYGCDAVMIGRGALGNPWIFSGRDPGPAELLDQIERHLYMMTQRWGDHGVMMMRKHLVKYIHGRPGAAKLRSLLMKLTEPGEIVSTLGAYLGVRR